MPSIPFEGFASKSEALTAFYQAGMTPEAIAARLGWSLANVRQVIRQKRLAVGGTAGIWTPDKIAKARRLFGKTMVYIAEALNVPPEELLHYALDGAVPPMGLSGRLGDLRTRDGTATPVAGEAAATALLPAPEAEAGDALEAAPGEDADGSADPDFHAGEVTESGADLESVPAALPADAEPDDPPADGAPVSGQVAPDAPPDEEAEAAADAMARAARSRADAFRLLAGEGRYVHESLEGFTANRRFAWCGSRRQLVAVIRQNPKFKRYDVEPVFR